MQLGPIFPVLLLGGALSLLGGCAQSPRKPAHSAKPPKAPAAERGRAPRAQDPAATASEAELERRTRAHAAFAAGLVAQENNQPDQAQEFFARSLEDDPANEPLALEVARRQLERKQTGPALTLLRRAAAQPGASAVVRSFLGLTYLQLGRKDEAIAAYRDALRAEPAMLGSSQALAQLLTERQRPDEALKVLDEALDQNVGDANYWVDLADLFNQLGAREPKLKDTVKARTLTALEKAAAAAPDDPVLLQRMGERYEALGETDKAEGLFKGLRERFPRNPVPAAKLAELYLRHGRGKEAREQLEVLKRDNPANPLPFYYLGLIALDEKEPARAAEQFERALLLNSDFEPAYADLAAARLNAEQPAEALATLDKARGKFGAGFRREYLAALAHGRLKRYDEAFASFQAAEKAAAGKQPDALDHTFYFQVGAMLERAGRAAESEAYLLKALALKPDYDEALNHLGYSWADQGVNLDRARDMIERAVKAEPENPAYLDSLGWVLFKLGKFTDALAPLEQAVKLLPESDATVLDHLGDVLAALGRRDEAKEAWRKSLGLEPSDGVRRKLDAP